MTKKVTYLNISDVHLGHGTNPTSEIVQNLKTYINQFNNKAKYPKIDIIFIVGDLLDQLLNCSDEQVYDIIEFIEFLIKFCINNNIKLRVLEGTPSHDRKQNRLVMSVLNLMNVKADIKWIKTLHIERMEDLDLSILYIPDEFTSSAEITLGLVHDLFKEQNIEQVDIAMMHGMFKYQMKDIPGKHDTHDEDSYLALVKHFINIGHIHTSSSYKRIIAQGSFDRLAHGQEEKKGGVLNTIRDNGSDYFEFIENKNAKIFKTIELKTLDYEKSIAQIEKIVDKLPDHSRVRIKANKFHVIFMSFSELKTRYPFIHFSKITLEDEKALNENIENNTPSSFSVIQIRPDNVVDLIMDEIKSQVVVKESDRESIYKALAKIQTT